MRSAAAPLPVRLSDTTAPPAPLAGMLLTDLLLKDSTPAARRFFNALAEEPETVAAALAPQVGRRRAAAHMQGALLRLQGRRQPLRPLGCEAGPATASPQPAPPSLPACADPWGARQRHEH